MKKVRGCLKCGKQFDSVGVGNRICKKCKQINIFHNSSFIYKGTNNGKLGTT